MKTGGHVDWSGLDELRRRLDQFGREQLVPIGDLLTPEFMRRNTPFSSVDEMFESGGFEVSGQEDFDEIRPELDAFVARETRFTDWEDMLEAALIPWTKSQLGL